MTKYSLDAIDKLLSSFSDEELRSIVRSYALTHPTMIEALKGKNDESMSRAADFDYVTTQSPLGI